MSSHQLGLFSIFHFKANDLDKLLLTMGETTPS